MKVVCCKNCGAKYQLDDDDDITTFECSSCAGELEYLEEYSDDSEKSHSSFIDSFKYDNSYIVQPRSSISSLILFFVSIRETSRLHS